MLSSTSHRVWHIPELLDVILEHLRLADLAQMARTWKFAHYPCVKHLWRVAQFEHLIQLFPPDCMETTQSWDVLAFTRTLQEEDWERFKHYSVNVKTLLVQCSMFSYDYFEAFRDCTDEMFPRLHTLHLHCLVLPLWPQCTELVGLSLKRFQINRMEHDERMTPEMWGLELLLSELPLRTPQLTSLVLPTFSDETLSISSIYALTGLVGFTLQSLPCLTHISWLWPEMPDILLQVIGLHPSIRTVCLSSGPRPSATATNDKRLFSSLVGLEFGDPYGGTPQLEFLLQSLAKPEQLETISITLRLQHSPTEAASFSRSLSFLKVAINLTRLEIRVRGYTAGVQWAHFLPLLHCHLISAFIVEIDSALLGLDDGQIHELAKSWPEIKHLEVYERSIALRGAMPALSLLGLAHLVKYCPKLSDLTISVSLRLSEGGFATPTRIATFLASEFSSSSKMGAVNLAYSRIVENDNVGAPRNIELLDVARILRKLCPNLKPENLRVGWDAPYLQEHERWENLRNVLKGSD